MCGVVGYVGRREVVPVLVKGLRSLEYRGYDSSGIAVHTGASLAVVKRAGRLANLERALADSFLSGGAGIGHTRWATHGVATDGNAHPFLSSGGRFAVVHNGIITNYRELAAELSAQGVRFSSDTDSEVIAHLIELYDRGDALEAIRAAVGRLRGSYALAILCLSEKDVVYGVRRDSPLVVGKGRDGYCLCSDVSGIFDLCDQYYPLKNGEIVRLAKENVLSFDQGGERFLPRFSSRDVAVCAQGAEEGDRMLAEIREIPHALSVDEKCFPKEQVPAFLSDAGEEVLLLGCGSAFHAGLVAKEMLRETCGVMARAEIASEFLTARRVIDVDTLVIVVSQSGETADTLRAAERAKREGARVLAICNVKESSLVRLSDCAVITGCGRECAVAATKSYCTQVRTLLEICLEYADIKGKIDKKYFAELRRELTRLSEKAATISEQEDRVACVAKELRDAKAVFYLGRGIDYAAAREGSLKLKEVSYLFSEAYPSGELKHGTLALMERGVYGVIIATDPALAEKNLATLAEITCRGATAIVIAPDSLASELPAERLLTVPDLPPIFSPVLTAVVMQQLAYFTAKARGCDPDHPRNLAKSVTVE